MKNIYIIAGILLSSISLSAQSDVSAWLLSSTEFSGTARYSAMGGAFGALGGDVSAIGVNPAGIGLFRRSELSFTPAFQINEVTTKYMGTIASDIKGNVNVNNLAYVSSRRIEDDNWKNVQFGISYNRLKDFQSNESIIGTTSGTSFADQLAASAQGFNPASFDEIYAYPAYQAYIFDPTDIDQEYVSGFYGEDVKQVYSKQTTGRIGETTIAAGANYNDRLYLGGAIGFQRIKMSQESSFKEEIQDFEFTFPGLNDYTVTEVKNTTGSGFGLKLGAIYRVNDLVRAGLAYHSPTFLSFVSDQNTRFVSNYSDGEIRSEGSDTRISEYNLTSPSKLIGSLAVILGKRGAINMDYEYVDYSNMKLRPGGGIGLGFL